MARITIEDCIEQVPNRFHLVQMTAIRAKQLKKGALPHVHSEDNKAVVVALREIATGVVAPDYPAEEPTGGPAPAESLESLTMPGPGIEVVSVEPAVEESAEPGAPEAAAAPAKEEQPS